MRTLVIALALVATTAPSLAADPPYMKLAEAIGTPHLSGYVVPTDHAQSAFEFTPDGQSPQSYKKKMTVSILKIPATPSETETAARGVIVRLRDELKRRKADITTFDESPLAPVTLFYEFTGDGETAKGIVYSPRPGYVTALQIDAKDGGTISPADVSKLKAVIASGK